MMGSTFWQRTIFGGVQLWGVSHQHTQQVWEPLLWWGIWSHIITSTKSILCASWIQLLQVILTASGGSSSRILIGLFFWRKLSRWRLALLPGSQLILIIFLLLPIPALTPSTLSILSYHIWWSKWFTGGVSQTVIHEGSEPLVTMPFSGWCYCTCLFTVTIDKGVTKRHSIESPRCQTYFAPTV